MKTYYVDLSNKNVKIKINADVVEIKESGALAFFYEGHRMPHRGFSRDHWLEFEEVGKTI